MSPPIRSVWASTTSTWAIAYAIPAAAQDAEAAYKSSLAIYNRVAKKHADVPSYSSDLAESYSSLAAFYCDAGRFQDALAAYQSAIDIYKALAGKYPQNTDYPGALADCYEKMGVVLDVVGEIEKSCAALQSDLAVRKSLAEGHPETLQFRKNLAAAYFWAACVYAHAAVAAKDPAGKNGPDSDRESQGCLQAGDALLDPRGRRGMLPRCQEGRSAGPHRRFERSCANLPEYKALRKRIADSIVVTGKPGSPAEQK